MKENTKDIIISGNNMDLTEALKSTVVDKVSKLFEHEGQIIRMRVELGVEQAAHNEKCFAAKGHIEIRGKDLFANVKDADLYRAIDSLVTKMDRMLRRRSRLRVLKRKHTHEVEIPAHIPKAQMA